MTIIKTWQERCEEHPDHEGIVTERMIRCRMQEEIDELRQAIAEAETREWIGLTDEEIAQGPQEVLPALYGRWGWAEKEAFEAVVAWAEAKLKEKNKL
jgi:hypothetical protein